MFLRFGATLGRAAKMEFFARQAVQWLRRFFVISAICSVEARVALVNFWYVVADSELGMGGLGGSIWRASY